MKGNLLVVVSVLTVLAWTSPSPFAARRGTDRPLSGSLSGGATFEIGVEACVEHNGVGVRTTTVASGCVSHLGEVEAVFSHCPPPVSGGKYAQGRLVLTAANGDELWVEYEDADGEPPFVLQFVGGTGRFEGAEGTADLNWTVTPVFDENGQWDLSVPWPWWGTLEGRISY